MSAEPGDGLHVGLIGAGRIGTFHAQTLGALPGVRALTIADLEPARAEELAARVGAQAAETPEALVEAGVDAFVVAAATPAHAPLLKLAARARIPAFCEKPVALDLATLNEVVGAVTETDVLVQVGFQRRFDHGFRAARDVVDSGELGKVLVVRAATHDPAPPSEEYVVASGGIFRDLHIHDFDAVRFVTGREIVEVYADGMVLETEWFARHDDVDTAVAVLRLDGGGLGILSGTRHDPLGYDVRLEVFGTADSISVGTDARSPIRSVEPGAAAAAGPGYGNFVERFAPAYRAELAAFVDAVRTRSPSPCPLTEARADLIAALAADRARSERRPVAIEEVA